jgi:7-carboxy-7-deazaguanine synthase
MSYSVKEVYYTLQGEGANAGRAAVFLRFTGCNLWSGRAEDRSKGAGGCSRWCDTDFVGTNGPGGGRFTTPQDLASRVASAWPSTFGRKLVVCTGGEPALQLDEALVDALHAGGFEVAIETNGTRPLPLGLDWICVSPKQGSELLVRSGHELKLVVPQEGLEPSSFEGFDFEHFLLQPMDGPGREHNTRLALDYCLAHPQWRLGLQTHKLLSIP